MAIQPISTITNITGTGTGIAPASYWNNNTSIAPAPKEYAIQGKMLTVQHSISDLDFNESMRTPEQIKEFMLGKLMKEVYESKMVEFTKMQDPTTGMYHFHARMYLVPDTMVRILRENGK